MSCETCISKSLKGLNRIDDLVRLTCNDSWETDVTGLKSALERMISSPVGFDYAQDWSDRYAAPENGGDNFFSENLSNVVGVVRESLGADSSCTAFSGFALGYYHVIDRVGHILEEDQDILTENAKKFFYTWLGRTEDNAIVLYSTSRALVILVHEGELFGFLCFERHDGKLVHDSLLELESASAILVSILADLMFSYRVRSLAQPFQSHERTTEGGRTFARLIAERAGQAFGADGVIFRLHDAACGSLEVQGTAGRVPADLLESSPTGSGFEGKVFSAQDNDWAAIVVGKPDFHRGVGLEGDDTQVLSRNGIRAALSMRLSSPLGLSGVPLAIGTLSYIFLRPHRFSWRDVALFRSFCQRVSDAVLLLEQQRDLDTNSTIVAVQSRLMTSVEIAALISHDLFHKAFHSARSFDLYKRQVAKAVGQKTEGRLPAALEQAEIAAEEDIRLVHDSMRQLRAVTRISDEELHKAQEFTMRDVVDEVVKTLDAAFDRQGIRPHVTITHDVKLAGPRQIMLHAVYNLALNTVDAVRQRKSRSTGLFFHGKVSGRDFELLVWDEGPGIRNADFRDPKRDVFEIGRTTKKDGSGMGLPVARTLLHRYFGANLSLQDPATARFLIRVPLVTR